MPGVRFPVSESIPIVKKIFYAQDTLAERLRRQPAKLLGSTRAGSNPAGVGIYFFCVYYYAENMPFRYMIWYAVPILQRNNTHNVWRMYIIAHTQ